MKNLATAVGALVCALSGARAQGLLDIGPLSDEGIRLPFLLSISSSAGWDSEPGAGSSTRGQVNLPGGGEGSAFWQNTFNLYYPVGRGRNRFSVGASYSSNWYLEPPPGTQEFQNSGSLHADYSRQINERLSIGDAVHLSYQTEPDLQIGASITRPTSGYFFGSNNLRVNFKWTTRFSIVTSHTVTSISYDDEALQEENYMRQVFSERFEYFLTKRTKAALDYRFSFSQYPDNPAAESQSHFILLGVDRPLGRFLSMSASGGVEFRSYDGALGSRSEPYSEAAINYHARKNTAFRLYYRRGLEDTGSAGRQSGYSRRMGLALTQKIVNGLSLKFSLDHLDSDFSGSPAGLQDRKEETLRTSAGLDYTRHLWRRFNLNASYSFSMMSSDDAFSEYNRHRVSLGVSATF